MRTAGLSLLTALTALHATTVNGVVTCSTEPLPAVSATSLSELQVRLLSTISTLCYNPSGEFGNVSEHWEGLVFELRRDKAAQDENECQAAFAAITSQCIGAGKFSGGESRSAHGIAYRVYSHSPTDHPSNYARAQAPAKPAPAKPAPAKPVPAKPAPGKPAPGKPAPVKPPPTPVKPPPAPAPAKTIKIGPTKDCKQLAVLMQTPSKKGKLTRSVEGDRGGFVGSRVDIKSKEELAKRAPSGDDEWDGPGAEQTRINHEGTAKRGSACEITFDALNYPKAASMVRIVIPQEKSGSRMLSGCVSQR